MPNASDGPLLDDSLGRMVRPYTVSDGRTRPTSHFDLMTMVTATGAVPRRELGLDHSNVLVLCERPVTVAEIAAHMGLPATVIKVLLSDLVDCRAVATRAFDRARFGPNSTLDLDLLEAVRDGLLKLL
ncbi:DUF742 domain-containing protein [Streptomyces sp. RB6PN25]|uniref:DUF742 domain-containing protein n=1 Tax=Streptomyces humicola TaxID=2953240 RepID=A0ABT1Q4K2_9ACTN|nr:DUF742 domain-containing protein [Streptomyces humicola]MCQ4084851.1 DUF742 domain-containing protein [Streptomyces humicola]